MWHTIYIYTQAVNAMVGITVLNCICLCLKRKHVVERTLQSIKKIIWVFITIIYHYLCHHRKRRLRASSLSLLYMFVQSCKVHASVHFNLFSRHWYCGSSLIHLQVGLHERRFNTASRAEEPGIHSNLYLKHPKSSRDHHQDEGYQDR